MNWTLITESLPNEGDCIACCARNINGGPMYWAGRVVDVRNGFATMEILEEKPRQFIITFDTLWVRLPRLP